MPQWLEVVGRLHVLLLHLPIGLIIGLGLLEGAALVRGRPAPTDASRVLVVMIAFFTTFAAATGFLLSREEGYSGDTVTIHLWLGVSVAVGALLTAALHARRLRGPYLVALGVTLALLLPTGHFGGVMTHGEGFVLEPLRGPPSKPADEGGPGQSTYVAVIAPILEARCVSCHGDAKHKGGLALHTPEMIARGGDSGPVLVAGNVPASELTRRLLLPLDDDDHMPPASKAQPKPEEIRAIEAWIAAGAPFDRQVPGLTAVPVAAPEPPPSVPTDPPPAPPQAIAALRDRLVHVQPLSGDSPLLWIDFAGAPGSTDADVKALLEPVREQVGELSLSRCAVTSEVGTVIAALPRLRRLDLRATATTDGVVEALRAHERLEELVLAQTRLSDSAIEALAAMPALKRVHLWNSGVTPDGAARLRQQRPTLEVDTGDSAAAATLEVEPDFKLTGDAPVVGAKAVASLEPVNKVCPVSGTAVDPKFAVVHKGRVVGFCCPNCPGQFWANPEKFEAALAGR